MLKWNSLVFRSQPLFFFLQFDFSLSTSLINKGGHLYSRTHPWQEPESLFSSLLASIQYSYHCGLEFLSSSEVSTWLTATLYQLTFPSLPSRYSSVVRRSYARDMPSISKRSVKQHRKGTLIREDVNFRYPQECARINHISDIYRRERIKGLAESVTNLNVREQRISPAESPGVYKSYLEYREIWFWNSSTM